MVMKVPSESARMLRNEALSTDLCIVGGGLAGTCAAITAARNGIQVVLIQDRPVLGGNSSSEVRLWALGATAHMGNNNRWAREGGVINELLTENLFRNRQGNALLFDALLLEKVTLEPNVTLLLNTAAYEVAKEDDDQIAAVKCFNSQNGTQYTVSAPLFMDASGDGVVAFLAGAAFRIGQESREEFGELYAAPEPSDQLLGHSLYFMSKETGQPTQFIPPANSLSMDAVRKIRRYRGFDSKTQACNFWWVEYGGHLNTIDDSELIKQELWRIVYGIWNFIKNSGEFPDAETLTLEWVGQIPGKRESRRFEGDYMLTQSDLVEQRQHPDAVSFGGWAIDHHPVEGLYSPEAACTQWHNKGVYQIPFRSLFSRNIDNLLLGGRIISVSHIAFGSTRVMATCAHTAQAAGIAATQCIQQRLVPRDLVEPSQMHGLQQTLIENGQYIPGVPFDPERNLVSTARISSSSTCRFDELPPDGTSAPLETAQAIMLPVQPGKMPTSEFLLTAKKSTTLRVELRISSQPNNHTPDETLQVVEIKLAKGSDQRVPVSFDVKIPTECYAFVCLMTNPSIHVHQSSERRTGILTVHQRFNTNVATALLQQPPPNSGLDSFEFWLPQRRPAGKNPAIRLDPPIECYAPENICNGWARPVRQPNAWTADVGDRDPWLLLEWDRPQSISRIDLLFDGDYDHPMETVLYGHPEDRVPFCISDYRVVDGEGRVLAETNANHQAQNTIPLDPPVTTKSLRIENLRTGNAIPASILEVRCHAPVIQALVDPAADESAEELKDSSINDADPAIAKKQRSTDNVHVAILVDTTTSWSRQLIEGILEYTKERDPWYIHLEPQPRDGQLHLPENWSGDGIIARVSSHGIATELDALKIPVVNISSVQLEGVNYPRIITAVESEAKLAADTFRSRGFRNFAYTGDLRDAYIARHLQAYEQELAKSDQTLLVHPFEDGAALEKWISGLPKPVAIYCWGPSLGHRVIDACRLAGVNVPHDAAILGSSYDELLNEASYPPQAGIRMAADQIGKTAATILDRMMRGTQPEKLEWHLEPRYVEERLSIDTLAVEDESMAAVMRYLRAHALQPISVEDVLRAIPMARRTMERKFRRYFGCSVVEQIRQLRINHARKLLAETDQPMTTISAACGFSSYNYLNRVFKSATGLSPSEYRSQCRAQNI